MCWANKWSRPTATAQARNGALNYSIILQIELYKVSTVVQPVWLNCTKLVFHYKYKRHNKLFTFISHLLVEVLVYWVLDVIVGVSAEEEGDWAGAGLGDGKLTILQRLREGVEEREGR